MANLKCFGSGSAGNVYLLECREESLMIELGLPWREILQGVNYDLSRIVGVLVSHAHGDHSKSVKDAVKFGLPVYSCKGVCYIYNGVRLLKVGKKYRIGGFYVQPISVPHSCECYAYVIDHEDFGRLLFVTDCSRFDYRIKGCNHILIEANYSEEILINNLCNDEMIRSLYEYHMEINDTVSVLKTNYNPELQNIVLLHLSNSNSNEEEFGNRVIKELGFDNVFVANSGIEIELRKIEF